MMTKMTRFGAWLPALGSIPPSLALFRGGICRRRPAGVGRVLAQPGFECFQAFEEGQHHKTHIQRGCLPLVSRNAEILWQGGRIRLVAHDALSSYLVSVSLP